MQSALTATDVEMVKVVGSLVSTIVGGSVVFIWRELRRARIRQEREAKQREDKIKAEAEEKAVQDLAIRKRDKRLRYLLREVKQLQTFVATVLKTVSEIEYQVKPNGSGSMNDRITNRLDALHAEVSFEISARRLTEHRAVFEGAVMLDGTVRAVSVSPQWTRITGLGLDDMQHDNWPRCIAPEHYDRVMKAAEASRTHGRALHETYDVINVLNGVRTTVTHTAFPIRHNDSPKIGWWVASLTPLYTPTALVTK